MFCFPIDTSTKPLSRVMKNSGIRGLTPPLRENFEISKKDILNPPSLRENFPQIYCLIKKNFPGASPPDPFYIGGVRGDGAPPPGKKLQI